MLYPLERRKEGLVMPTTLFNFLMARHIQYSYNFSKNGIELADEDYTALQQDYKPEEVQTIVLPKSVLKKVEPKKIVKRRLF